MAGLGEVQHRPHPGRRRRGRRDQDGAGDAARRAAPDPARRRADAARRLVGRARSSCSPRPRPWPAAGPAAPGRGVVVRHQRHQRARDPRAGRPPTSRPRRAGRSSRRGSSCPGRCPGARPRRCARAGRAGCGAAVDRGAGAGARRRGRHAGHQPRGPRAPRGGPRRRPGRAARRADRAGRRRARGRGRSPGRPAPRRRSACCSPGRAPAAGMGRELYAAVPGVRRGAATRSAPSSTRCWTRPLRDVVVGGAGLRTAALLDRDRCTQPALFAFEVALFRLLESLGRRAGLSWSATRSASSPPRTWPGVLVPGRRVPRWSPPGAG